MPRISRIAPGGMVFHVLNRGVGRQALFQKPDDYSAFEVCVEETLDKVSMRICAYCEMPNHWHLVLWPEHDGDLALFMQHLTVTHVTRWQKSRQRVGEGHVYQGRFNSFPVGTGEYFYQLVRYVERNALRANLSPLRSPRIVYDASVIDYPATVQKSAFNSSGRSIRRRSRKPRLQTGYPGRHFRLDIRSRNWPVRRPG